MEKAHSADALIVGSNPKNNIVLSHRDEERHVSRLAYKELAKVTQAEFDSYALTPGVMYASVEQIMPKHMNDFMSAESTVSALLLVRPEEHLRTLDTLKSHHFMVVNVKIHTFLYKNYMLCEIKWGALICSKIWESHARSPTRNN